MRLIEVSNYTKKIINISIALIVLYYASIFVFIPVGISIRNRLFPPEDLPNPIYGQLDQLQFVRKPILGNNPTYTLNTTTGQLPGKLPANARVYKINPVPFSYDAGRKAQRYAEALGFTDEDRISDLRSDTYKWRNRESQGLLEIPLNKNKIILNTFLTNRSTIFNQTGLSEGDAINTAKNLARNLDMFNDSLYVNGEQTVYLGKFQSIQVIRATGTNDATLARVDFFRKINNIPVFGPDPKKGLISITLRKPQQTQQFYNYPIVEAYYNEINLADNKGTYPMIPVSAAWQQVAQGNGVITNITSKTSNPFEEYKPIRVDKILVNEVYLAYYEQPENGTYIQPIYVFDGNYTSAGGDSGTVSIYFPAISSEYIKAAPENTSGQPAAPSQQLENLTE